MFYGVWLLVLYLAGGIYYVRWVQWWWTSVHVDRGRGGVLMSYLAVVV